MLGPDNSFKVSPTLADHAKRLGASLESVALFALYDVADQSLLRNIAGREFCEQVERLALLTGLHTSEASATGAQHTSSPIVGTSYS